MSPVTEIRPRPLFCVIAGAHADLAVAREVCQGQFREAGQTVNMALPPDWATTDLPADGEWRIAWHKFYYGLHLSHAFAVTGERRFLDVWRQLVLSFIDQIAPTAERDCHVASRRVLNWLFAWVRFASTDGFPGLGAREAERIADYLGLQAAHIRRNLSPKRNHRTIELTALFHAALALPALDADGRLLDFCGEALYANLKEDIAEDGVHVESSTHYHMISLRNFLGSRLNAQRYGVSLPPGFDRRLEQACEFAMHCHRPDGGIPALSDSDSGSYLDLLALAADLFGREDFRYAASGGRSGHPPQAGASFPQGGYFVQRSSWGEAGEPLEAARYLIWDCGQPGEGGHVHYDALHLEMAAHGRPLLIDPGRFTYSEAAPNWRHWFKGTAAHNTVCVDGKDQTPYQSWDVASGGRRKAKAEFRGRWTAPGIETMWGAVESPSYSARHQRRILFVSGEYWLVEDRLTDGIRRHYDLRFHLTPSAQDRTVLSHCEGISVAVSPGLTLVSSGGEDARIEEGWVAPAYGVKEPAPVISIRSQGESARFLTLLFPIAEGSGVSLKTHHLPAASATVGCAEIRWQSRGAETGDSLAWGDGESELETGPFRVCAAAAWLRRDGSGRIQNFAAAGVSALYEAPGVFSSLRFPQPRAIYWDAESERMIGCGA